MTFNLTTRALVMLPVLATALLCGTAEARKKTIKSEPGQFDYYALAMSWSPQYCAGSGNRDPDQCAVGRKLGFVLHGLWPQFEKGYPQNCSKEPLPDAVRTKYESIFAAPQLIGHEWSKHGTCSGLPAQDYMALSARLKNDLAIPAPYRQPAQPVRVTAAQFKEEFRKANRALADNGVLPFCTGAGRFLREVHACYDKDGHSRSCSAEQTKRAEKSCGQGSFLVQSVR
jgi:ribonuclease T2